MMLSWDDCYRLLNDIYMFLLYIGRLIYITYQDQFCTSNIGQYDSSEYEVEDTGSNGASAAPICIPHATIAPTVAPTSPPVYTCDVYNPSYLGDGFCDKYGSYNTPACGYDGGDCCARSCLERGYHRYACGYAGYDCKDPAYLSAAWLYSETERGFNCTSGDLKSVAVYKAPSCTRVSESLSYDVGCSEATGGELSYRYYSSSDCTVSTLLNEYPISSQCSNSGYDIYHPDESQSSRTYCSWLTDYAMGLSLSSQYPDKKFMKYR